MKKALLVLVSLLVVSLVALPLLAGEAEKGKKHDLTVVFVSYDKEAKTMTIKNDKGGEQTVPVKDEAMMGLAHLKGGEKVVVTCLDNEKGEHQAVVMVKPAPVKTS